jgi:transcriptional regulator with XRE-family HTH domain
MNNEPTKNAPAPRRSLRDLLNVEFDEHAEILRNKREDAAIELCDLLHQVGISRAELARKLDWKPSRVTRALSGKENLTLNTLAEIINAAGMDYDLVFRKKGSCRSFQPWDRERFNAEILCMYNQLTSALGEVKDLHQHVSANLDTARELNRAAFRRASAMKQAAADNKRQPMIATRMMTYCEEDDAPIARKA